ncbi:hypothetical protein Tco_0063615, partial [Tanacetum coccineum]
MWIYNNNTSSGFEKEDDDRIRNFKDDDDDDRDSSSSSSIGNNSDTSDGGGDSDDDDGGEVQSILLSRIAYSTLLNLQCQSVVSYEVFVVVLICVPSVVKHGTLDEYGEYQ